ncbi:MAG TPA: cyanophycinase, partial [Nocardioidaceae bacterium]|nr:cyanophycinase [Nocardioidaceae bacterium]
ASSLGPEVVEVYDALFRKLGAAEVVSVRPESRDDAHDPAYVDALADVTGIFMTGGNQLKLSAIVNGTEFGEAIKRAHRRGAAIAGTSAGASIQSSHMVAFGPGGATPKQRMTQVAAGLGLLSDCVVDQHFAQRNRYGRLLSIVAQSPNLLGIGVDEDTAMIVTRQDGRQRLEVAGRGAVTLVDGRAMVTNAYEAKGSSPLLASGVTLHVLPAGAVFDLESRSLVLGGPTVSDEEVEDLAVAGRELSRLARDIAAGDASPSVLRRRRARRRADKTGGDPL